jgi:hypothetical protein
MARRLTEAPLMVRRSVTCRPLPAAAPRTAAVAPRPSLAPLQQWQHVLGNRHMAQWIHARRAATPQRALQRQLNLGSVGDHHEQEAERVAVGVSRAVAGPGLHAKCEACCREEEMRKSLGVQRKAAPERDEDAIDRAMGEAVESRLARSKGAGEALPQSVREPMETSLSADFSRVRVHTNEEAVKMSRELGAKAFTHGSDIYFNADQYSPATTSGRELLTHELTHVVQQSGGGGGANVSRTTKQDLLQLAPNVTAVNGPAELAAGLGRRATLSATAARGTVIDWSFQGASNGATLSGGTGRTTTLTAPAASTGGAITVRATDHANAADFADLSINLVEVQQPTFTFAPAMPAFAPANTMDASVCNNNATAAAVTAPAARPLTWRIVGNRLGATIDPVTGVILPSATQTGTIRVRATDNAVRDAFNEQTLTIQAHPTGITRTAIAAGGFPIPAGPYGAIYTHTFKSSGGAIGNVMVTERVACGNGPFSCAGLPVVPGILNAPAGALQDIIGTPSGLINANNFLPSPPNPGLPQVMDTPQILYWRSDQCSAGAAAPPTATPADHWVPFVNVPIKATLLRRGGNLFFQTSDNGVATPLEPYVGPALAAPGAPAASACGAGEALSNMSFSPATIGADGSPLSTTAASVRVRPGGNLITWSFPGPNFGASIAAQGNPALFSAGTIAGQVRVRAALTATPGCFTEGFMKMAQVVIGPAIRFSPSSVRAGATTRASVSTAPGNRIVLWTIAGPTLGAVIAANPDNSATITAGANVGRITVRATDQRDPTRFTETSLVIN